MPATAKSIRPGREPHFLAITRRLSAPQRAIKIRKFDYCNTKRCPRFTLVEEEVFLEGKSRSRQDDVPLGRAICILSLGGKKML